jgi:hypothetical protein
VEVLKDILVDSVSHAQEKGQKGGVNKTEKATGNIIGNMPGKTKAD